MANMYRLVVGRKIETGNEWESMKVTLTPMQMRKKAYELRREENVQIVRVFDMNDELVGEIGGNPNIWAVRDDTELFGTRAQAIDRMGRVRELWIS